jgi:nucleoside-diphosphate-sugar epimerase
VVEPPEAAGTSPFRLALDLVAQGLVPVLPGAPTNTLDFISAADAAAATARILLAPGALGTYHVASGDRAPQLIDVVRTAARRPVRFAAPATAAEELGRLRLLHPRAARSYEAVTPFIEALAYPKTFDTARAEAVLGGHPVSGDPLDLLVPSWPLTPSRRVSEWLSAG